MTDTTVTDHLDDALGAVLAARAAASGTEPPPVPDDAVDVALGSSEPYTSARMQVRKALDDLQGVMDADTWKKVLVMEAAMNAAGAEAVEVAWELGWMAGSSVRER